MKRYRLSGYSYNGKLKRMEMLEHSQGEWVKYDIVEEMYDVLNVIRQSVPLTEYTQSKIDKILQKARGGCE